MDDLFLLPRAKVISSEYQSDCVITLFAIPKPFVGHIGVIQRNAITSWTLLQPKPEIILFGDDEGTAEICSELGLKHVPNVARNQYSTPYLDDLFHQAQQLAGYPALCYVNADIILLSDFTQLLNRLMSFEKNWLAILRRWEVKIEKLLNFEQPDWEKNLQNFVLSTGRPPFHGVDCFIFPSGFYKDILPFALGRGYWDDWLIWYAHKMKARIFDASDCAMTIHQGHPGYNANASSAMAAEVKHNYELDGKWRFIFHKSIPTHKLTNTHVLPVPQTEYFRHVAYRFLSHTVGSTYILRRRLGLYRWWQNKDRPICSNS